MAYLAGAVGFTVQARGGGIIRFLDRKKIDRCLTANKELMALISFCVRCSWSKLRFCVLYPDLKLCLMIGFKV